MAGGSEHRLECLSRHSRITFSLLKRRRRRRMQQCRVWWIRPNAKADPWGNGGGEEQALNSWPFSVLEPKHLLRVKPNRAQSRKCANAAAAAWWGGWQYILSASPMKILHCSNTKLNYNTSSEHIYNTLRTKYNASSPCTPPQTRMMLLVATTYNAHTKWQAHATQITMFKTHHQVGKLQPNRWHGY